MIVDYSNVFLGFVTIVQEPRFANALDDYSKIYPRMSDVHDGVDWLLGRDPNQGAMLSGEYRVMKTTPIGETPSFWVLYRYVQEEAKVYLVSVKVADSDSE
jgi:hypothetical protein